MIRCGLGFLTIATVTTCSLPTLAGGGFGHYGVVGFTPKIPTHISHEPSLMRHLVSRHPPGVGDIRIHPHVRLQSQSFVEIWPYVPFDFAALAETPTDDNTPGYSSVIVLTNPGGAVRETSAAGAPPDYSYVPGCRPIPNGYFCDTHDDGPH
jgi:hypothetical protein